jgi:Na+:H+ antiporter, NhaC family
MTQVEPARQPRPPSLVDSLVAVAVLIGLVSASFLLFGENAAYGPGQVALTLAATLAGGLAWKNGHAWDDIRKAVVAGIAAALPAIFILFAVGALIGTWAMSGTLVAMVYYALGVLSPTTSTSPPASSARWWRSASAARGRWSPPSASG